MLSPRKIDNEADKDTLLEFHCRINYESETPWARIVPFEQYREKWLSSSQTKTFLGDLAESMADERTIAEIWEDGQVVVGYLWVTFSSVGDYNLTIAEVRDIAVVDEYQRRGIGRTILEHAEQLARDRGAHVLRSGTGIDNTAAQGLHVNFAFKPYRIEYEKLLDEKRLTSEKLIRGRLDLP